MLFFLTLDFLHFEASHREIDPEVRVDGHVKVCNPHQREEADEVAAPVLEEKFEAGKSEESRGHIVTEAVFAGEKVEELALNDVAAFLAATRAVTRAALEKLLRG